MKFKRSAVAAAVLIAGGWAIAPAVAQTAPPANGDPAPTPPEAVLPLVRVTAPAPRETATGPVDGYRATRSATATRTDVPLMDTPVSVQVVSRELIDDQKALKLKDALTNVSGVFAAHGPDGNTMDAFIIRGFQVDSYGASYLDGVKDFSRSPKEVAGVERIEVLKGPAAIMYGRIEPGGLINRVAKRPHAEQFVNIDQEVGTDQHLRTTVDANGMLSNEWLYRVNIAAVDEDGYKNDTHNRRLYLGPQVEWRPSDATSVRAGVDYLKERHSWALTYGTIGDINGPVDIPIETNLHGKDDHYREESTAAFAEWTQKLSDQWQSKLRASYAKRNSVAHASGLDPADVDGNYTRWYWGWEGENTRVISLNADLQGKLRTGDVKHTLLLGADFYDEDYDSGGWAYGGTLAQDNIHHPRGDSPYRDDYSVSPYGYKNRNLGVYLQDQMALLNDKLHILLGVRHDSAKYESFFGGPPTPADDSAATWRVGALYKLQPNLGVYASYVTGFGQAQFDWAGGGSALPPQTSKQFEVGTKYEPTPDMGLSIAAFKLIKDNLTMNDPSFVDDPDDPLDQPRTVLAGEATSKGIELDISGRVGRQLDLVATYTYTDVRYTNSDTYQGERLAGVPRHGASLWGSYRFAGSGWRTGAGVVWRSSMVGLLKADEQWEPPGTKAPYTLHGYTLLNAMVAYDFKLAGYDARTQLNVNNLTDERYNPTTYGGSDRIGLGEPRSIVATLGMSF